MFKSFDNSLNPTKWQTGLMRALSLMCNAIFFLKGKGLVASLSLDHHEPVQERAYLLGPSMGSLVHSQVGEANMECSHDTGRCHHVELSSRLRNR